MVDASMTWNEFGWFCLCLFNLIGLCIIIPIVGLIASPFLAMLYLIDYVGYLWTGYTSAELDRIIAEKHRCSKRRLNEAYHPPRCG